MRNNILITMALLILVGLAVQGIFGIAAGILISAIIGIVYGVVKKKKLFIKWSHRLLPPFGSSDVISE